MSIIIRLILLPRIKKRYSDSLNKKYGLYKSSLIDLEGQKWPTGRKAKASVND